MFLPHLRPIPSTYAKLNGGNVMLKGIRAMLTLSNILKITAVACTAAFSATSAAAENYTVYVYEKGFFPNKFYTDDGDRVRFVNKTGKRLGLDYASGGIMVDYFDPNQSVTVEFSSLSNRPLRSPYVFSCGCYRSGQGFSLNWGAAPES